MLTSGSESREFLYADDCSEALSIIMEKFNFFVKKNRELHLTTGKRIKIMNIAKIIQKILLMRNIKIKIKPAKNKDDLQNNMNNAPNRFFLKFWKPRYKIEQGIKKIIDYYQNIST